MVGVADDRGVTRLSIRSRSALLSLRRWSLAANPAIPEALPGAVVNASVHDTYLELGPSHPFAFVLTIC
jgi:hypothetical protein